MLCKGKSERGVTPNIANLAASAQHTAKLSSTNSERLISYCDASLSGPVPTVSNFFCAVNRRATFFRVPLGVRKGIEQSGILAADMSTTPCRITTCRILSRAHSSDEFEESPSRGAFTFSRVPRATSWRPRLTEPTTRPCFRWDFATILAGIRFDVEAERLSLRPKNAIGPRRWPKTAENSRTV
jgi:hypothetical protein